MANIVRTFVQDVLPALVARQAAQRKSAKVTARNDADRPRPSLNLPTQREPYRPAPDHHLRLSHL
jgi:hypothetical protein